MDRDLQREWLETDRLGGFASGTMSGVRTRRYHALLLAAVTPPTGRMALVNGFEPHVITKGSRRAQLAMLRALVAPLRARIDAEWFWSRVRNRRRRAAAHAARLSVSSLVAGGDRAPRALCSFV